MTLCESVVYEGTFGAGDWVVVQVAVLRDLAGGRFGVARRKQSQGSFASPSAWPDKLEAGCTSPTDPW